MAAATEPFNTAAVAAESMDEIAIFFKHLSLRLDEKDIAATKEVFVRHDIRHVDAEVTSLDRDVLLRLGLCYGTTMRFLKRYAGVLETVRSDIAWAKLSDDEKHQIEEGRKEYQRRMVIDATERAKAAEMAEAKSREKQAVAMAEYDCQEEERRKAWVTANATHIKDLIKERQLERDRKAGATAAAAAAPVASVASSS
jgi:hypothetical protein